MVCRALAPGMLGVPWLTMPVTRGAERFEVQPHEVLAHVARVHGRGLAAVRPPPVERAVRLRRRSGVNEPGGHVVHHLEAPRPPLHFRCTESRRRWSESSTRWRLTATARASRSAL